MYRFNNIFPAPVSPNAIERYEKCVDSIFFWRLFVNLFLLHILYREGMNADAADLSLQALASG